jgi:hypothetical protein
MLMTHVIIRITALLLFSFAKVTANGLRIGDGGILALKFNRRTEVDHCIFALSKLFSPPIANTMLGHRAFYSQRIDQLKSLN